MLPYIYAGEEVTVMSHLKVSSDGSPWSTDGYVIRNADGLQVVARAEDVTLEPVPPPKSVEQKIRDAFREGYSRGLTGGNVPVDDRVRSIIHVATDVYIQELKSESTY